MGDARHVAGRAVAQRRKEVPLGDEPGDEDHARGRHLLVDLAGDLEPVRFRQRRSHDQHIGLAAAHETDGVAPTQRLSHDPEIPVTLEQTSQPFADDVLVGGEGNGDHWRIRHARPRGIVTSCTGAHTTGVATHRCRMTVCTATVYSYTYGRCKSDASPSGRAGLCTSMRL